MAREDIKPYEFTSDQSRTQAARNGQKGGIASGESKRRKRTLREMVEIFGELGVSDKTRKMMKELDIPEDLMTRKMQPVVALYNKAGKGDVAAFNAIRDITGEKPVDETKVTGNIATEITINLIHTGVEPVGDESEIR